VIKRKSEYLRSVKSISEFLTRKTLKQIFLIEFVSKKRDKEASTHPIKGRPDLLSDYYGISVAMGFAPFRRSWVSLISYVLAWVRSPTHPYTRNVCSGISSSGLAFSEAKMGKALDDIALIGVAMGEGMPRSGLGFKQFSLDHTMRVLRCSIEPIRSFAAFPPCYCPPVPFGGR
jgi:hypothetical protein